MSCHDRSVMRHLLVPQMAPINWISIYWRFIIILLLVGALNYYLSLGNLESFKNSSEAQIRELNLNEVSWKW